MGEKAQVLPGPLPISPGLQQEEKSQGCWLATLDTPLAAPGTDSFTIQPTLCEPGHAGGSARSPVPPSPALPAQFCPSLGRRQAQAEPPARGALPWPAGCFQQRFGTPPHPPRARGHPGVSAATGWTVFVNLLETSQYSPELHLLHALKLTVQATRMTLTDLAQYHVF